MTPIIKQQETSSAPTRAERLARVQFFAAGVLLVCVLYWARDLLVPCALALLIAFLLAPIVDLLRRFHLHKAVAVTIVTIAASALLLTLIGIFAAQCVDLLNNLPNYKQNLITKVEAFRPTGDDPLTKVSQTIEDLSTHISATQPAIGADASMDAPIKTTIVTEKPTIFEMAARIVTPILTPLAVAGTVFVLVFFFLLESEIAEVRLRYLIRRLRLGVTDEVIDDTTARLGRYLRMQLIVNLSYGLMVTVAMWAFGVPNFALWGMSAALLRYVPYLGPLLAAALPTLLSIAVFPGWGKPLWIAGCFLVAETITNGILEPMLYGRGTGVSSLGVVISAFFWYWLWGPIGIILAMPLTICLVVVGKQIPMLAPLAYLFSGDARSRHRQTEDEIREPTLFDPPEPPLPAVVGTKDVSASVATPARG